MNASTKIFTSPSKKAEEIISVLRIRAASEIEIVNIAMERGAFVRERPMENSEARLIRKGGHGIITVNSGIPEAGRKRFAIAHELGHFELHEDSQLIHCSDRDMYFWTRNKTQEIEANEFASNILLPKDIFKRHLKAGQPTLDIVKDLAGKFTTTLTATGMRYVELSPEPCAMVISKDGVIKWYVKSADFDFHIKVGEKLNPHTYAFDYYDGVDVPESPQKVPACAWLAGRIDEEDEIIEHSLALRSYDVVLTLLWIDREIHRNTFHEDKETEYDLMNPFTQNGKRWKW